MSINIADNMGYNGKKPLDNRVAYSTLALMKAVTDANIYEGCEAYCAETDKYYKFLSTNTVDETTGKWRERATGGGGGGGHTIEDSEGTSLTQRDTLQFGEGFIAEDDDTNKKTVISPDVMQSGDMSDVITPLPSVQPRYQKYSTEEQIVGTWIDGKPLYQKTIVSSSTFTCVVGTSTVFEVANLASLNIATIAEQKITFQWGTNGNYVNSFVRINPDNNISVDFYISSQVLYCRAYRESGSNTDISNIIITLQYTKTTD